MTRNRIQIGWLTIGENQKRLLSYETASWYTELLLDVGKYPIMAELRFSENDNFTYVSDNSIHAVVEGTVTGDNFPSSFGGVQFGKSNKDAGVGKRNSWHYSPYAHAIAHALVSGEEVNGFELLDDFVAIEYPFISYDGTPRTTYIIKEISNG
jgi:hypothetical protein